MTADMLDGAKRYKAIMAERKKLEALRDAGQPTTQEQRAKLWVSGSCLNAFNKTAKQVDDMISAHPEKLPVGFNTFIKLPKMRKLMVSIATKSLLANTYDSTLAKMLDHMKADKQAKDEAAAAAQRAELERQAAKQFAENLGVAAVLQRHLPVMKPLAVQKRRAAP